MDTHLIFTLVQAISDLARSNVIFNGENQRLVDANIKRLNELLAKALEAQ